MSVTILSEQEILRDEIRSLQSMRNRLRLRVDELEGEVKALREEIENARKAAKSEEEVDNNQTYSLNILNL